MEQRCKIILQNYLQTQVYNTDYTLVKDTIDKNNFTIYYKNNILFEIYNIDYYVKYIGKKEYYHNMFVCYYNNKNNRIIFTINKKIKMVSTCDYNNRELKYYNKFCKIYKKIFYDYSRKSWFNYYYKIKPYNLYIYKLYNKHTYILSKLYSNHYSIMFLLYIIFDYICI